MIIAKTLQELREAFSFLPIEKKTIGFVPTMGALHAGHISLVKRCVSDNDVSVVSIFVNPTQFNDKNDLINYPRTLDADIQLLEPEGVDVIFAPGVDDIYPRQDTRVFDFGGLDKVMEGVHRPGHFNGVAQVVSRLFELVKPSRAYFGEKDFQQLAIIRRMVEQLGFAVEIVPMPIVREKSGLAMSSRNALLSDAQRISASKIYETLSRSKVYANEHSVEQTKAEVVRRINAVSPLEVEYFEIVDGESLLPICNWSDSSRVVGCIAVYCGCVRLIDNISY